MDKRDIKNFTIRELKEDLARIQAPSYRASQIFYWIYKRGVCDFKDMNNLSGEFKSKLKEFYYIGSLKIRERIVSFDGTEKFLFELSDGHFIESVFISSNNRKTICLSTQVGCKYACRFCASGLKGFVRDLSPSEILDQILVIQYTRRHRITNFVFMGMGEPLDNYENLSKAIEVMNCSEGLGIGARRITVSTCGIIPGIEKIKDLDCQINLSISLHAVDNKLRDSLMPVNKIYPLEKLIKACRGFIDKAGRKITFEYILIKGTNDSLKDVDRLSFIARGLKAKVNLIAYSPVFNKRFERPAKKDLTMFKNRLTKNGVNVTIRKSKGIDIQAACGQLAMKQAA